jgi:translation initiation factor IF-1
LTNEVLDRVKEEKNTLKIEKEHAIKGKIEGRIERMEIRVRRSKQLMYDLKETRGYWKCKKGSTRSSYVENCLWKSLWTCSKADQIKNTTKVTY